MNIIPSEIKGLLLLEGCPFEDHRGDFLKVFHTATLASAGVNFDVQEVFHSTSKKGVIRGMHFQAPPYDHAKLIFVTQGAIQDVALDLRKDSNTYGQHISVTLSKNNANMLYIPSGFAHGFRALEDNSTVVYLQSSMHEPAADSGILYNSFGCDWEEKKTIVSERDLDFISLSEFKTPFE